MMAIALASLGVTVLRRRHGQRVVAARVATRLAALAGVPAGPSDREVATQRRRSVE